MEDIPYTVGGPDVVQKLDAELRADVNDLKTELEENEILRGVSRATRYFFNSCFCFTVLRFFYNLHSYFVSISQLL